MAEQRIYHAPGLDVQQLGQALVQWYQGQGFESQILPGAGGAVTVQARKTGGLQTVSGMAAALNVMLTPQGENLVVQAGGAKWADKAAVGVASLIIFWPLAALPVYGAYKQRQVIDETFNFVQSFISSGGTMPIAGPAMAPVVAAQPMPQARCPSCGQPVREGAKFCDNCGASLTLSCAKCGAELRPGAKFCDECGAPVEAKK